MKLWPFRRNKPVAALAQRRFEGASVGRLNASWFGALTDINADLRGQLPRLRARSRDLAQNNDYVRRFLSMVVRNVVGPQGFNLQARSEDAPGVADDGANSAIEHAFDDWCKPGHCDVTGRYSFADLCRLLMRTIARDGEALVIMHEMHGTPYRLQLQVVEICRLDTSYCVAQLPNGNRVWMGVELTPIGKPAGYYLLEGVFGPNAVNATRRRVDAADVLHLFIADEPEQVRGFPWLHTAMIRLHHLAGYEEAAIIAARIGAAKAGVFVAPEGDPAQMTGHDFMETVEPGEYTVAPPGYDLHDINPAYPHQQYDMFVKACLRGIASGLDVSYNTLANDLEGVNFSSIRSGVLEERENWMAVQAWFVGQFLDRIYDRWLLSALGSGAIVNAVGTPLPFAKLEKFRAHEWQPRRWQWVDPLKDMQSAVLAIENNLVSPQMIAAQTGRDLDTVLDDIAAYRKMLAKRGIPPPAPSAGGAVPGAASTSSNDGEPAAGANP